MSNTLSLSKLQPSNQPSTILDRRRFIGPESSTAFVDFPDAGNEPNQNATCTATSRSDGRSYNESRPLGIKTGVICQANGSCYLESGKNKVICAVYGPKPRPSLSSSSSASPLVISLRFAPFCMPGGRLAPTAVGSPEATISQLAQQALVPSLLPSSDSSIIEIHITALEWDSPLSPGPCILASSIAMASAGIPMLGLVIPTTLALTKEPCLDPTASEAATASAIFDLASIPAMGTVAHVNFRSTADWKSAPIEINLFDRLLEICKANAELVHDLAANTLKEQALNR